MDCINIKKNNNNNDINDNINNDINNNNNDNNNNNNNILFKFTEKIASKTDNNGTQNAERLIPLKYLSNFWKTFEFFFQTWPSTFFSSSYCGK